MRTLMLSPWRIRLLDLTNLFILVNILFFKLHFYHLLTQLLFTGFAVLDISKTLMYDYHYNVMKKFYRDKIKLMYTDTGKYIKTILMYIIY